jgi:hypothetical protein
MDRGLLSWEELDIRIVPFVRAAEKFRLENGGTLLSSEEEVRDFAEGVIGHYDAIYQGMRFKGHKPKSLTLVDWKTNMVDDATAIQTAKYQDMWQKCHPRRKISYRCGVALQEDGQYKVTWFPGFQYDLTRGWKGALLTTLWKIRNGAKVDDTEEVKE